MDKPSQIRIRRHGALGDVICTTPVVSYFLREFPSVPIIVETRYKDVFKHYPWPVKTVDPNTKAFKEGELFVDLELAYEKRPNMHIVDAYFKEAGILSYNKDLWLPTGSEPHIDFVGYGHVLIHAPRSWPSRSLTYNFWSQLVYQLTLKNVSVKFVGTVTDLGFATKDGLCEDWRERFNLHQLVDVVGAASCVIASDSSLIHVTGTTSTPLVGLFTCAHSEYRMPFRSLPRQIAFDTPLDCGGCLARAPIPTTYLNCELGTNACVQSFDPVAIAEAAISIRN